MSRILITGSNGFAGKNLQQYIKTNKTDHEFLFPSSKAFNCLDYENMKNYIENKRIDVIVHMAAKCGGILANKNAPADFLRDNTLMGINIYELAREYNISNVIGIGTTCAYPVNCPTPFKEMDLWNGMPELTNFSYAQSKRTLLSLGNSYRSQYGIKGCHLIPGNMFGLYDHFDLTNSHVIPAMINKFVSAKRDGIPEVNLWGSGNSSREFLFAEDLCSAIIAAIDLNIDEEQPINIGTGKEIVISDLAEMIAKLTGFEGKLIYTGDVSDGQPRRCLDISRAKKILKWKAKTNLKAGLIKTIEHYKSLKV